MAAVLVAGALIFCIGVVAGFRAGRVVTDREGLQLRVTAREFAQFRRTEIARNSSIREVAEVIIHSEHCNDWVRDMMEHRMVPLITERKLFG